MNQLKRIAQFGFIFVLFNSVLFYIGWNGWEWLRVAFDVQNPLLYSIVFVLLSYSFVLGRLSKYVAVLRSVGYVWMAVIQYGLILLPIADLAVLLLKWSPVQVSSAIYFVGISVIVLFAIIFAYGLFNAYIPVVRKYQIQVPKKKGSRTSLRLAVASDMHFGRLSGISHLRRLVEKITAIKPDLILLPGDIIDDEPEPFIEKNMGSIMSQLKAPLGVFGVLGNHEYYGGKIPEFIEQMNKINITIMTDDRLTIGNSFQLIGRKDKTDKERKTFKELLTDIDRSYPIIAMDHQPFELKQAQENGVDILFSGHTHRGQMAPNHLITKKMYELDWGYLKKEQLHAFVSSGFGFWGPPLRIGGRSEILQIDVIFI
ncbi:metallophosphoesterase [Peribacillus cavernae]|uniref:Metallophosphoesterase n=1 Tax=Peribacillus cavernae TaxID=1674310 RepID=A0A3S0TUF3_9BACI|nr:metallophosphoesterase [Peribacillus cavernae]MDQ0217713.1 putative MPP superfamily phosphohydrolase [Peribacillus cavernae]RUQ28179.1 metallophosphoesterase [Peribacillus cavernae]